MYLSFVIPARNDRDDPRLQICVSGLQTQIERHGLDAEIIVVDWNPPPDRPKLAEILSGPLRVIEVPPDVHNRYENSDKLAMYAYIAINTGILRAKGEFILPSSQDLLYSDELMQFLASERLDERKMYRANRYDVDRHVPYPATLNEQLTYCCQNVLLVKKKRKGRLLHTSACGDFTLLSREAWHWLRGFPEYDGYHVHLDGILMYIAHRSGYREKILRFPLYHIDHDSLWKPKKGRLRELGIPFISLKAKHAWIDEIMREEELILLYNDENWGLGDLDLPEVMLGGQ